MRARIGTTVNDQDLGHGVARQGTGGDPKIKRLVQFPLVPEVIDQGDIQIGLGVLDYQIPDPSDRVISSFP